jgi:group I intron endonuclease
MTCGIYLIRCRANGYCYVGKSVNIERRWNQHADALNGGTHHNRRLQRDWNLYGPNAFAFQIHGYYVDGHTWARNTGRGTFVLDHYSGWNSRARYLERGEAWALQGFPHNYNIAPMVSTSVQDLIKREWNGTTNHGGDPTWRPDPSWHSR